ncbi:MAG: DUF2141 domain-containing protein [Pseudomonadota bacterium]
MNTHRPRRALRAALLAAVCAGTASAADLTITLDPVADSDGTVMLALYSSASSFRETLHAAQQAPAIAGTMQFTFSNLAPGDYAVMVMHDRNGNGELDTNLLGLPREPWGASLQGKRVFGPPGWEDTRFTVPADGYALSITLR